MLDNFLFGTATSAYQIEGAWDEDGKCPSIWDEISHGRGRHKVLNGHTGDIAGDHYHRWKEDVELMKQLGINAYRFSISWSRICTKKDLCTNLKGIEFYRNLVKGLKEAGIEPFVTLYHWDLPKWLDDIGGWANPKSIDYFKCYAETMFNALPDVKYWITFNEPAVFVMNFWGHDNLPKAIRNVLLAHGKAIEHVDGDKAKVGISLNLMPVQPNEYGDKKDEIAVKNLDKRHNGIWLEPVFNGQFPDGINKLFGFKRNLLKFSREEKEIVSTPIDFLGINYYTALTVKYDQQYPPGYYRVVPDNFGRDEMGVEIKPHGLFDIVMQMKERYNNPDMYITENGCACPDTLVHDTRIHDTERIRYIRAHLRRADQAVEKGANLKGYFYWSFMDNFEWLFGYNKRFGLVYIYYPVRARIPKDSFRWYQHVIQDKNFRKKELNETFGKEEYM